MIWGIPKVTLSVARHTSKFCIRFGHVQVGRDFGRESVLFCSTKPLFQKKVPRASRRPALDRMWKASFS